MKASRCISDRSCWILLITVLCCLAAAAFFLRERSRANARDSFARKQMMSILLACRAYSADWDGQYPNSLRDLIPDYIESEDLLFATDRIGERREILYFPPEPGKPLKVRETPMLEYPFQVDGQRIVGLEGGHLVAERIP